jgi:hypothetical protein
MQPLTARLRAAVERILPLATLVAIALIETAGRRWQGLPYG